MTDYDDWLSATLNLVNDGFDATDQVQVGFSPWITITQLVHLSFLHKSQHWNLEVHRELLWDFGVRQTITNTHFELIECLQGQIIYIQSMSDVFGCLHCPPQRRRDQIHSLWYLSTTLFEFIHKEFSNLFTIHFPLGR